MKNFFKFLFVIAIVFSATLASGQARYDKGDMLLNAGLGLGYSYFGGGVPVLLSLEFAVNDVVSVGPYLGYTSYSGFRSSYRYSSIDFGIRGSYHFSELFEIRNEKIDVYGGAFLGYLVTSTNYDYSAFGIDNPYPSRLRLGLHAGTRYYFSEKVSGFGELGFGIAALTLGVSFKL